MANFRSNSTGSLFNGAREDSQVGVCNSHRKNNYEDDSVYENQEADNAQEEEDPRGKELEELRARAMVSRRTCYWEESNNNSDYDNSYPGNFKSATLPANSTIIPPPKPMLRAAADPRQYSVLSTPQPTPRSSSRSSNTLSNNSNYQQRKNSDCTNNNSNKHAEHRQSWSLRAPPLDNSNNVREEYGFTMMPKQGSFSCTSSPSPLRRDARLVYQVIDGDESYDNYSHHNHQDYNDRLDAHGMRANCRRPEPPPTPQPKQLRPPSVTAMMSQSQHSHLNNNNQYQHRSRSHHMPGTAPRQCYNNQLPWQTSSTPISGGHRRVPVVPASKPQSTSIVYDQAIPIHHATPKVAATHQNNHPQPSSAVVNRAPPPPATACRSSQQLHQPASSKFHQVPIIDMSCSFPGPKSSLANSASAINNNQPPPQPSVVVEVPIERSNLSEARNLSTSCRLPSYPQPTVTLLKTMREKRERTPEPTQMPAKSSSDYFRSPESSTLVQEAQIRPQQRPPSVMTQSQSTPHLATRALEVIETVAVSDPNNSSKTFQVPIVRETLIEPKQRQQQQQQQQQNNGNRSVPTATTTTNSTLPFQVPISMTSSHYEKRDTSYDAALNNNQRCYKTSATSDDPNSRLRDNLRDRLAQLIDDLHQLDTSSVSTSTIKTNTNDSQIPFIYRGSRTVPIVFIPPAADEMATSSKTGLNNPSTESDYSFVETTSAHNSRRSAYNSAWSQTPLLNQQPFRISSLATRGPQRDSSLGRYNPPSYYNNNNSGFINKSNKSVHWDSDLAKIADGGDDSYNSFSLDRPLYSPRSIFDYETGKSSILQVEAAAHNNNPSCTAPQLDQQQQQTSSRSNNNNENSAASQPFSTTAGGQSIPVVVLVEKQQSDPSTSTLTDVPPYISQTDSCRTPVLGANTSSTSPLPFTTSLTGIGNSHLYVLPPGRQDYVRVQHGGEVPEFGFRRPCVTNPSSSSPTPTSPAVGGSRPNSGVFFNGNGKVPSTPSSPSPSSFFTGSPAPFSRQQRFGSGRVQTTRPSSAFVGNTQQQGEKGNGGHKNRFFSTTVEDPLYPLPPPDTPNDVAKRKAYLEHATDEIRRRKALQSVTDSEARRHHDFLLPSQKTLLPSRSQMASVSMPSSPVLTGGGPFIGRACKDFMAVTRNELTLNHGDVVQVVKRVNQHWLEGYLENDPEHRLGIFPATHVKPLPTERDSILCEARFNFTAEAPFELSFSKGDLIAIHRRVDEKWYEGRLGLATGIFPASYVRLLSDPPASFFANAGSPSLSGTASPSPSLPSPAYTHTPPRPASRQVYTSTPAVDPAPSNPSANQAVIVSSSNYVDSSTLQHRDLADDRKIEARKQWFLERTADPNGEAIALADLAWERYEVAFDYDPHIGDEIVLRRGDVIQVIDDVVTADYSYRRMVLARKESGEIGVCPFDCLRRL